MMEDGRTLNPSWLDYRMPTIHNMAVSEYIDVVTESYKKDQPYRTKEVGKVMSLRFWPRLQTPYITRWV